LIPPTVGAPTLHVTLGPSSASDGRRLGSCATAVVGDSPLNLLATCPTTPPLSQTRPRPRTPILLHRQLC
jgi:hypothetical protein